MMIIPDFSHHNKDNKIAMECIANSNISYIILKATEGTSYTDPELFNYVDAFCCRMRECGALNITTIFLYHFCRLDKVGAPQSAKARANQEMVHFADTILKVKDYIRKCFGTDAVKIVPVLDWETSANTSHAGAFEYLKECLRYFTSGYDIYPTLYASSSVTKTAACKNLVQLYPDIPLWVAHYNVKQPKIYNWQSWTGWQFTSSPFDMSLFRLEDISYKNCM